MRTSDELLRDFSAIRERRNSLRQQRAMLFCERAEPGADFREAVAESAGDPLATFEMPQPTQEEPCWKAARKWDDEYGRRFYFDPPPAQWCAVCRQRQEVSDAYREAVQQHGGALRGLLRRGKALRDSLALVDAGPQEIAPQTEEKDEDLSRAGETDAEGRFPYRTDRKESHS